MSEVKKLAARAVHAAKDRGAWGCEVLLEHTTTLRRLSHGLAKGPPRETATAHVRVYLEGGRVAVASTPMDGPNSLEKCLATAMTQAKKAPLDEHQAPPDRIDIVARGLGIHDPRMAGLEDEAREEVLSMNEQACRNAGNNVVPGEYIYEESRTTRTFESSRGVEANETTSLYTLTGSARLTDRPEVDIHAQVQSRHFADVASVPVGVALGRRAKALERDARLPDGLPLIVIEPRAAAKLVPPVAHAFDAVSVEKGKSFLSGRMGSIIASEVFHVVDDAALTGALATRGFDDRGVSPIPVSIIREGAAAGLYVNCRDARIRQGRPTGHHRFDDSLWTGNLVVRPGSRSRNMIFADVPGAYIIVEDVVGTGGIDPVTGAVDVKVRLAVGSKSEVLGYAGIHRLRGSIESLLKSIVEMASDHERHGIVDTGTWICQGLEFAPSS